MVDTRGGRSGGHLRVDIRVLGTRVFLDTRCSAVGLGERP